MSSILPRVNSGYKRVDASDDKRAARIRFGWKKFAIIAAVVISLVWLFGPRERRESVIDTITQPTWGKPTRPPENSDEELDSDEPIPAKTPSGSTGSQVTSPHSPAEDPDPLKTVHCTSPANPSLPLVQYALMIDAGSTGSRIHIYKFNNCGSSPAYEYEVFRMTHPGLSSYKSDALGAAESLDVLLDEAVSVVPKSLWSCTPVAVKATAGLRLLGAAESEGILQAVRHRLQGKYPFALVDKDGVVIMDGKDEGVFAWITANYLLGTIRTDAPSSAADLRGQHSFAVLDLGGGSTQIVFEPDFDEDELFIDGDHKYELDFGGKKHTLYQHSYLGYGLMSARKSVHRLVEFMATINQAPDEPSQPEEIPNPCLYKGSKRAVQLDAMRPGEEKRNVTMVGQDVGSFDACNRIVELVMAKDAICQTKPCSFNGVYQPSILETFAQGNVLLLSYFYDRLAPFFPSPFPSSASSSPSTTPLTVSTIASLARDVCEGPAGWDRSSFPSLSSLSAVDTNVALREDIEGRPEYCLDLTFMHALLRLGYEFPADRGVRVEKHIEGTELGWCLGAAIAMVGGELTCRK